MWFFSSGEETRRLAEIWFNSESKGHFFLCWWKDRCVCTDGKSVEGCWANCCLDVVACCYFEARPDLEVCLGSGRIPLIYFCGKHLMGLLLQNSRASWEGRRINYNALLCCVHNMGNIALILSLSAYHPTNAWQHLDSRSFWGKTRLKQYSEIWPWRPKQIAPI